MKLILPTAKTSPYEISKYSIFDFNLSNYYLLPFVDMVFKYFSVNNTMYLIDTYINATNEKNQIIVRVLKEFFDIYTNDYLEYKHLVSVYKDPISYYIIFQIPNEYLDDFEIYKIGKYSKFSEKAKNIIYSNSGVTHTNNLILCSLNPDENSRKFAENQFGIKLKQGQELLYAPVTTEQAKLNKLHHEKYNLDGEYKKSEWLNLNHFYIEFEYNGTKSNKKTT